MKKVFVFEGAITSEQPLATCSKSLLDSEGGENKPTPIPSCNTKMGKRLMFPATGLRGALRRAVRDAVRNRVIEITGNEKPFSLDECYLHTLGGIKGKGEEERKSVAHDAEWRVKNPLLSLFGAGDAGFLGFMTGNISIGNAICIDDCKADIFSGARTDEFYRDRAQVEYLSDDDIGMLIKRAKGGKTSSEINGQVKKLEIELKKAIKAGDSEKEASMKAVLSNLSEQLSEVKESSGTSDNSIGRPLAGWQTIPQGQELSHRMILAQSDDIELGLVLAGLDVFSRLSMIGAHFASGCGLVSARWTVYEIDKIGKIEIGNISIGDFSPIQITGEKLNTAFVAFEEFMANKKWDFSIPTLE